MLPKEFEQVYIRLYWKGKKDEKPNKTILDKFHNMKGKKEFYSINLIIRGLPIRSTEVNLT